MKESIRKADILIEALPYLQKFRGTVMVAKYGGSAIDNPSAMRGILQDLVFLSQVGIHAVLVHGGGPAINRKLSARGAKSRFVDGLRVTDASTIRLVNRALEEVNRHLVRQIDSLGGHAVGITPRQKAIVAEPHPRSSELGSVGTVAWVQNRLIRRLMARQTIPVISPVGIGHGRLYNINADDVASAVAASLRAEKLVLLTNVRGIFNGTSLIPTLSVKDAKRLVERRIIQEGMIPKVKACVQALWRGVKKTHVIDAAIPHALLLEIFTKKGIGTEIVK
ncbi:MAG: acetylglutamate kinase [Candidatus Omnitrophica bacterium]|nr:acetylglutamate kinase [Candidatus Omnitrophota bacterium]